MATLPSATVTIDAAAGAGAGGTGYCVVIAPVGTSADSTPRVFSSARGILAQHNYAPGVDYAALHIEATKKPVIFVGVPVATAGTFGQNDQSGVVGTSVITTTGTPLEAVDAILTVTTGGTIGATGIKFTLSMDGGITEKTISLGTAVSYTVPYLGIVLNFAAGTLVAADEFTFKTTAPMYDSAGLTAARVALAAQLKLARSFMPIGEVLNSTQAGWITTELNAYETSNERFAYARTSYVDRLPLAAKSKVVGETLTFVEVGASGDTLTRSAGSWIADGFKTGQNITISGSVLNNITTTLGITVTSATVITLGAEPDDFVAEAATASEDVTITVAQTMAAWVSAADTALASIDAQKRVDISLGRLRKQSPITGWSLRRPSAWAASIREYQHDLHIPTWAKEDGPLDGWSMLDEDGNVVEFDERTDGGGLAGRFTCPRTWANGPNGSFIAMSLTRDTEGSLLSYTHNMAVANLGCTIVQKATENVVGKVLQLNDDGTATSAALQIIEEAVNTDLEQALLREFVPGEGPRASKAVWRASTDDNLGVVDATLTGTLDLQLQGTVVHVATVVKIS
jgi:hypothetical protein